jgi:ribosomal protein L11
MSKAAARMKSLKKVVEKVKHGKLRTNIPAGMAAAGPPLGPHVGSSKDSLFVFFLSQFNGLF